MFVPLFLGVVFLFVEVRSWVVLECEGELACDRVEGIVDLHWYLPVIAHFVHFVVITVVELPWKEFSWQRSCFNGIQ